MGQIPGSIELTEGEAGFINAHVGWSYDDNIVVVCLGTLETLRNTGRYRTEKENTSSPTDTTRGRDISWLQINDDAWPEDDPFLNFSPVQASRRAKEVHRLAAIAKPSQGGFWPWLYPSATRTPTSIGLTAMAERIGPNPLLAERNPYWRLVDAGIPVYDLPKPPQGLYISRVPLADLRSGNHGAYTYGGVFFPDSGISVGLNHGDLIGLLQRLLDENGFWYKPGYYDRYYGANVVSGVTKLKQLLADLGAYDGPINGIWDLAFAQLVDGMRHYEYLVRGR